MYESIVEIVFVRHAEKQEGEEDLGLSDRGVAQAKNLARRLSKEHFDELYCSGLKRSKETAQIISEEIGLNPIVEISLNEVESDLLKNKQSEWNAASTSQYVALKEFLSSFSKREDGNKRILIIAHGNTNRLILAILLELDLKNLIRFRLLETAICEAYWMPKFENWRLKCWNDVAHQPKDLVEGKNKY